MSVQHRNNPDIESPAQEFPGRAPSGQEAPGVNVPADDHDGTVNRDEEE